jgi:hypothetical protein
MRASVRGVLTAAMVAGMTLSINAQQPETTETEKAAELAKKLANPVAALISVPLQYNYVTNYGVDDDGTRQYINIQPVIPFSISDDWNVISRTILPLVDQRDLPTGEDESGLGDTLQSLFFSPKKPTRQGIIWGAGPVLLIPTATDEFLGGKKWGAGPTAVALKQNGPWTLGFLGLHIWSFAGDDDRADVSVSNAQPFVSYVTKTKTTFSIVSESSYDWNDDSWSIPITSAVGQLFKIGSQIMQLTVGATYWVETPESGPEGWAARVQLTLLFPR